MAEIKPDTGKLSSLMADIESGIVKIPAFQREFVWRMPLTLKLLDSLARGYPIGTLLFWETDRRMGSMRNIGNVPLSDVPEGRLVKYVLDGQQRLTSLLAAVRAAIVGGRSYAIMVDLDATGDQDIFLPAHEPRTVSEDVEERDAEDAAELEDQDDEMATPPPAEDGKQFVSVADLLAENPVPLTRSLTDARARRFGRLRDAFNLYPFSLVMVRNADLNTVCEIFERVNNLGQRLDVFDLAVANTWTDDFDLRERWREFHGELVRKHFDSPVQPNGRRRQSTVAGIVGLQAVAAILRRDAKRDAILDIGRTEMAEKWAECMKCLGLAIDFVRSSLGVPAARLLPYPAVLVPIAYFYHSHAARSPNRQQRERLRRYFWRVGVMRRYSMALESMLAEDLGLMDAILSGDASSLEQVSEVGWESIAQQGFSMGNAFCRTVLAAIGSARPLDLETGDPVSITNSNIVQANSRHYHHLFPRAWLRGQETNLPADSVANISFVRQESNLRAGRRPPSGYLPKLRRRAQGDVDAALESQFVGPRGRRALDGDQYDRFLRHRSVRLARRLSKLAGAVLRKRPV